MSEANVTANVSERGQLTILIIGLTVIALLGVAGIVFGVLTIIRGTSGPDGVPFSFENYGGPGPIIAGLNSRRRSGLTGLIRRESRRSVPSIPSSPTPRS